MPSTLFHRGLVLVAIGLAAGTVHSMIREVKLTVDAPKPFQLPSPGAATKPPEAPADPGATAPGGAAGQDATGAAELGLNVTIDQARQLFDLGMVFIDARYLKEYEEGHVDGAFWLPTEQFGTPGGMEVLSLLDAEAPIIVYCGGGECDASKNVVSRLQEAGKRGARIMHDGFPAWKAAGHPVGMGAPMIGGPS